MLSLALPIPSGAESREVSEAYSAAEQPSPLSLLLPANGSGKENAIEKINYTHDAVIDLIIAEPQLNQGEIAKKVGYTQAWLSRVIASDAFQKRLSERKKELVDPVIVQGIKERMTAVAMLAADNLLTNLETKPRDSQLQIDALEAVGKALGWGAKEQNINQQANFVVQLPQPAIDTQSWLEKHGGRKGEVVDV